MLVQQSTAQRQNGAAIVPLLAGLAVALGVSGAAQARSIDAPDFSVQIGVASEYVGKGLGKSAGDPSVNGAVEVSSGDFYASVFASTAKLSQGSDAEIVSAIGWRPDAAGFQFDLSVVNRDLPGTRAGVDANFWEYQADASRKLGPVNTRLRINYTPDGFAATREAWWVELQGTVSVGPKTKASAAIADRTADGGAEYAAWNVGVKHKLTEKLAADVRWYDTDSHALGENYDGRLVGALTYAF
ncbi:TorF family putative porin [Brevundimonas sp. NPDC058933]|uniref:TorF family putative porin n=1 Tax=Brevundimonas sp. NPDC058933 TaxID=3346673 RepID=UPI003BEEE5C1